MADSTCPFCAEPIDARAKVCKACGEAVDGPPRVDKGEAPPPSGGAGKVITIIIVVVVLMFCGIGLLATLLMPALMKAKTKANRTKCANNLRQAGLAMIMYADDKRFFPHVRGREELDGDVATSDSPKVARSLMYFYYLDNPDVFICPESMDLAVPVSPGARTAPQAWFWSGQVATYTDGGSPFTDGLDDPTLDQTTELSYGWSRRAMNSNARSTALLSADRAVREEGGDMTLDALYGNHQDGWNVGQADGAVMWTSTMQEPFPGKYLTSVDREDDQSGFLSIKIQNAAAMVR